MEQSFSTKPNADSNWTAGPRFVHYVFWCWDAGPSLWQRESKTSVLRDGLQADEESAAAVYDDDVKVKRQEAEAA